MTPAPVPATREFFRLAEGPRGDAARGRLLWVDILGGAVLEGTLDDGRIEVTGGRADGPRVVPAGERRRLNDGAPGPAGRFLVGTMSPAGDSDREVLVRLEADGPLTTLDDDLTLSNGLAWSTDGRRMFSADSGRRTVFVRAAPPPTARRGSGACT